MSATTSPRDLAIRALINRDYEPRFAPPIARVEAGERADILFRHIEEPDRDMVAAGLRELCEQITRRGTCPETVIAVWRAMLDKARA